MKKNMKVIVSIITLVVIAAIFAFNQYDKKGVYSTTNYYLDTVNEISVINVRKSKADKILPGADKVVLDINNAMSSHLPSSEVSKINDNAGISPVKVSNDTFKVIQKSIAYSKLTNGKFDIAIGPLTSMWNIGNDKARVPEKSEIDKALPLINSDNIILNSKNTTVYLKEKGMKLDLGGIAKGYCADKVAEYLKENGVDNAIVNLGGNIYVMGKNEVKKDFVVGIQNPLQKSSDSMASVKLSNKSIVTSGIYERFLEKDGKIYHHMLDPDTGYPFDNELSSVTIFSDKSVDGDALSTSIYGLGLENGMKKVKSMDGIDAVFITKDNKVYITDGIRKDFKILDDKYTLVN
ncbi:MAG: FAD:protein FMN transferase [Peptostreptococcus sp.]|uniref:FAD:protein FMN transferase n=1 Tax=Peptostreptococcus sp. TaxID=1262 RepID=UPI002FCC855F